LSADRGKPVRSHSTGVSFVITTHGALDPGFQEGFPGFLVGFPGFPVGFPGFQVGVLGFQEGFPGFLVGYPAGFLVGVLGFSARTFAHQQPPPPIPQTGHFIRVVICENQHPQLWQTSNDGHVIRPTIAFVLASSSLTRSLIVLICFTSVETPLRSL
jgi:hypothetical protein